MLPGQGQQIPRHLEMSGTGLNQHRKFTQFHSQKSGAQTIHPLNEGPPRAGPFDDQIDRGLPPLQVVDKSRVEIDRRSKRNFLGHQPGPAVGVGSPQERRLPGQGSGPVGIGPVGGRGHRTHLDALEGPGEHLLGEGRALQESFDLGAP